MSDVFESTSSEFKVFFDGVFLVVWIMMLWIMFVNVVVVVNVKFDYFVC